MTEKSASFLAAFLCVLPIALGLEQGEMNLVKLIFYPLAWRCLCDKMLEVGLIPKFWGGEVFGYMIACCLIPYTYTLEKSSCIPAIHRLVR